jgi:hypothetical protein
LRIDCSGGSADLPCLGVPEDPVEECSKVEKKDARTNTLSDGVNGFVFRKDDFVSHLELSDLVMGKNDR